MKIIVSASLGSSKRDHEAEVELLGKKFKIKRIGTDGDLKKAKSLLKSLDGKVDAIGLGGIDLYLYVSDDKKYIVRDARKLKEAVKKTPVVDGSGLKNTLERWTITYLVEKAGLQLANKTVLMVSAVDRIGMADALVKAGCQVIFGDLIFGLHLPFPIRTYKNFKRLASIIVPVVTKMPFKLLYPTGEKQEREPDEKYAKYYREADIIAGDFLFIRKHMPKELKGKWILTNTVTKEDVEDLKKRGVELLITTTPEFNGRSFGTNVLEATFLALLNKKWEEIRSEDYLTLLKQLDYKPRIEKLN